MTRDHLPDVAYWLSVAVFVMLGTAITHDQREIAELKNEIRHGNKQIFELQKQAAAIQFYNEINNNVLHLRPPVLIEPPGEDAR